VTLPELLENKFRGDIRFRGEAYFKAERVAITHVTPETICGVVREGGEHETQLSRTNGNVKLSCSCSAEGKRKSPCKHLWATILAADADGYVSESLKPGHVPPFLVDEHDDATWFLGDDDTSAEFDTGRFGGPAARRRTASPPEQPRKPWERRLDDLRKQLDPHLPAKETVRSDREIVYEVDPQAGREAQQLVLQVFQRKRRAGGQWGTPKPLRLRSDRLDEVEHEEDRRILAFLVGAKGHSTAKSSARSRGAQAATSRFQLPHELSLLVLPSVCATGRLFYRRSESRRPRRLNWDDGEPWQLAVVMQQDDNQNNHWLLYGRLERDEETLPVADADLLLPGGLVIAGGSIARLRDFDAFDWIAALNLHEGMSIPQEDGESFVDRLLDMPALPRLHLPEPLRLEEVRGEPVPYVFLKTPTMSHRRWHSDRLDAEVRFEYADVFVSASSSQWAIVQRDAGRCVLRDTKREEALWSELQAAGFRRIRDRRRGEADAVIPLRDLGKAVRELVGSGWHIRADGKPVRQPANLHFRVRSEVDWFELDADVRFEEAEVAFPELLSALSRGDNTIRLDDGSLGILPEEWIQQYGLLAGLADIDGETVRLGRNQVALLDALLESQESVDYDEQFAELKQKLTDFRGIEEQPEPEGFRGTLRHYQQEGLGWLEFLKTFRFGGCLADDMGLGKTIQVLALLLRQKQTRDAHMPSLIVVPKSLLFNWHKECRRFVPGLNVVEYVGTKRAALQKKLRESDVVLTTYGTLRRDAFVLKDVSFDYAVLDEAQTIKNPGSQVAKASRLLDAKHRIALSGTPIENHLGDLWSIFEFLNPGMLGRSSVFRSYTTDFDDEESRQLLTRALRPFILRRTKDQVANELPEKFEQTIVCHMGGEQRRLYNELREHYQQSLLGMVAEQGLNKSKMHVLEALLRLRQAACHPALLDSGKEESSSAKLDFLLPHLDELIDEGHKTLVFSQFTSMLAILRRHLDRRNLTYEYLDGQTRDRKTPVERFQNDPDCGIFLISLKAGGLGLNLTAADYVFLLDPWWNPAVETQAIDRTHRVGQTRHVFAYRLVCRDTVEEKIAKLQKKKKSLAEAILSPDGSMLKNLTTDDLKLLLS